MFSSLLFSSRSGSLKSTTGDRAWVILERHGRMDQVLRNDIDDMTLCCFRCDAAGILVTISVWGQPECSTCRS